MTSSKIDPDYGSPARKSKNADNETPKQKIEEDISNMKREAKSKARDGFESGQHRIADEADTLSDAIDAAAANLDDHDREGLARYAREVSSNLSDMAGQLEGRSVDELANDAKRLARKNPALFMLGSVVIGFGLSRFFAASAEHNHDSDHSDSVDAPIGQNGRDMTGSYTTTAAQTNSDGRGML